MGDIQVNLVDKHQRSRKSHEIAVSIRDKVAAIAEKHGGNAKVVRKHFESTADIVGVDDTIDEDAQKIVLRVNQAKAALLGVAQADIVQVVRMGLSGESVTPVHDGDAKYEIPVRIVLPSRQQDSIDQLLKLKVRAMAQYGGGLVPISEVVEVRQQPREKVIYHKDLLPVVFVTGDMGG